MKNCCYELVLAGIYGTDLVIHDRVDEYREAGSWWRGWWSPLYWLSCFNINVKNEYAQKIALMHKMRQALSPLINIPLTVIFCCETTLGHAKPFPWAKPLLSVFTKP